MSLRFPDWVVFHDDDLIVVDKPVNVPSQRTRTKEPGIFEMLQALLPYVGLHHRLDRRASGLMVFTARKEANASIAGQLKDHTLGRTYLAIAEHEVESGEWNTPVGGKQARTTIESLEEVAGATWIRCRLHTGRTHQIRIHASMNGTPLVGDVRYGGDSVRSHDRLCLHASGLDVVHPSTGETMHFQSPVDFGDDFKRTHTP